MVRPAGRSAAVLRRLLPAHPGPRRRRVAPASACPPQRARMLGRELGRRRRVRTGRLRGGQREPPAGHAARADVLAGAGPGPPGRGGGGPRPGHRSARAGGKERQRPADVQRAGRPRVRRRVARRLPGGARAPGPAGTPGRRRGPDQPSVVEFLPDEIEALAALGETGLAEAYLRRLHTRGQALRGPWALATAARCRAHLAGTAGDHRGRQGGLRTGPGRARAAAHAVRAGPDGCSLRASPSGGRGASRRRENRSARRWPSSAAGCRALGGQGAPGTVGDRAPAAGERAHPDPAAGCRTDRAGPDEPGGRRGDVHYREHGANACPAYLPKARRAVTNGTRRGPFPSCTHRRISGRA